MHIHISTCIHIHTHIIMCMYRSEVGTWNIYNIYMAYVTYLYMHIHISTCIYTYTHINNAHMQFGGSAYVPSLGAMEFIMRYIHTYIHTYRHTYMMHTDTHAFMYV
jgi:hypothetical protein